jgi:hypothetical protein
MRVPCSLAGGGGSADPRRSLPRWSPVPPSRARGAYCCIYVTLLLHCCYTVVTLLLNCCYAVVTLLLHCCHTASTILSHCSYNAITLLSHFRYTVLPGDGRKLAPERGTEQGSVAIISSIFNVRAAYFEEPLDLCV